MGAWGMSAFENDDAMDWAVELEHETGLRVLSDAFDRSWIDRIYLELPKGSVILAAGATLVAAKFGDHEDLPHQVTRYLDNNRNENFAPLRPAAVRALRAVLRPNSEIYQLERETIQLFETSNNFRVWKEYVRKIISDIES